VLFDAANQSEAQMHVRLEQMCADAVPGDTHRNLKIEPEYSRRTFKHILVPIWLLAYTYGSKRYQVVVNGYTGKTAGQYPKSVWKVLFLIVAILIVVLLVLYSQ
jgi:uncharacterized membrane protein YidH (DUF202 family)